MPLVDASTAYLPAQPTIPVERGAEWAPRSYWQAGVGVDFSAPVAAGQDITVYVNEGRWIAECPDCHGAQIACRTDRRFMCHCCGNAAVGGKWRAVVWPTPAVETAIAAALEVRQPANRNWVPGETPADLAAENARNGAR